MGWNESAPGRQLVQPMWSLTDELSALFALLLGRYPSAEEITLDYALGMRDSLSIHDIVIRQGCGDPVELDSFA